MIVREMKEQDKSVVIDMVHQFYMSDAVTHGVDDSIIEKCFVQALSDNDFFKGFIIEEKGIVGYAYVSMYFATELGDWNLMIEQLYICDHAQNKGLGTSFIKWLEIEYHSIARFRLEVNEDNKNAIKLYQKLGFQFLNYGQMVKDF